MPDSRGDEHAAGQHRGSVPSRSSVTRATSPRSSRTWAAWRTSSAASSWHGASARKRSRFSASSATAKGPRFLRPSIAAWQRVCATAHSSPRGTSAPASEVGGRPAKHVPKPNPGAVSAACQRRGAVARAPGHGGARFSPRVEVARTCRTYFGPRPPAYYARVVEKEAMVEQPWLSHSRPPQCWRLRR
jgi:hypothetical protein